ncbi:HD domain-containing protein [Pleurostoma richardsiae]|uniref:HD domain-containing protein n=1 Tax=Pleurostoma richardsiae TaxID=41990 RepID=A0AA38S503_9PEZI|nr:HD domain-containing protein [Pleurostoma richardsiae]
MAVTDSVGEDPLVQSVTDFVEEYMSHYDASHDFNHIRRVLGLARFIFRETAPSAPHLDLRVVTLAALLHDVGDRKYVRPGEDPATMAHRVLRDRGAPEALARAVQAVCLGVSYTAETRDPAAAAALLAAHPELAVVQDADRLDAIGAVGIGRCFTYGGAKTQRSMGASVDHFEEKLLRVEGMMKTEAGRRLARERSERLRVFREWWREEEAFLGEGPAR